MLAKHVNNDSDSDGDEGTIFKIEAVKNISEKCDMINADESYLAKVAELAAITIEPEMENEVPDKRSRLKELVIERSAYFGHYNTAEESTGPPILGKNQEQHLKNEEALKEQPIIFHGYGGSLYDFIQRSTYYSLDSRMSQYNFKSNFDHTAVSQLKSSMSQTVVPEMPYCNVLNKQIPNSVQNPFHSQSNLEVDFNKCCNYQQTHNNTYHSYNCPKNPHSYGYNFNNPHNYQNSNNPHDYYPNKRCSCQQDPNNCQPYSCQQKPNNSYQYYRRDYSSPPVLGIVSQQILNSCDNLWHSGNTNLNQKANNNRFSILGSRAEALINQTIEFEIDDISCTQISPINESSFKSNTKSANINELGWMFAENYRIDNLFEENTNRRRLYERSFDESQSDGSISTLEEICDKKDNENKNIHSFKNKDVIHTLDDVEEDISIKTKIYGMGTSIYRRINDFEDVELNIEPIRRNRIVFNTMSTKCKTYITIILFIIIIAIIISIVVKNL